MTIKNYECEINTGNACHIACKKAIFGPCEAPIINKDIAKLLKLDHVYQIQNGEWLSKPLLGDFVILPVFFQRKIW